MHVVYETFPPKYEIFIIFCSFLCISLNVLVSIFLFYRNLIIILKNSLIHLNLHREFFLEKKLFTNTFKFTHTNSQIQLKFHIRIWRVSNTTCNIFPYFQSMVFPKKKGKWENLDWRWVVKDSFLVFYIFGFRFLLDLEWLRCESFDEISW